MWLLAMFDLPVLTKPERKAAAGFRKALVKDGFMMLQFSVYARPCPNEENAKVHVARVRKAVPPAGEVRVLLLTDLQFGRMTVVSGGAARKPEKTPPQLSLF